MSDIFQEVEEDVRRERYEKLWADYGNYIIALASVMVLGVGAWQGYQAYDLRQRQAISERYEAAQQIAQSGDAVKSEAEFSALVKDAPAGYAQLAKFHLVAAYLAQGKIDPALTLLRELVESPDPVISNTARLRLAWATADGNTRTNLTTLLQPLMATDSPWRFAASEVIAYLDIRDGARGSAQAAYEKLAQEPAAPQSLRTRATAIAEYLKANPTANPTLPAPPTLPSLAPAAPAAAPAKAAPAPARGAPAPARGAAPAPARGAAPTQRTTP